MQNDTPSEQQDPIPKKVRIISTIFVIALGIYFFVTIALKPPKTDPNTASQPAKAVIQNSSASHTMGNQ